MRPEAERFWEKVDKTEGCWLWTAYRNRDGYGRFRPYRGHQMMAHRYAYELLVGPIPDGLQIDHLCRVRACCNPAHLEAVTCRENLSRAENSLMVRNGSKTHCKYGHEFTPENTHRLPQTGYRLCRACRRENRRAKLATNAAA